MRESLWQEILLSPGNENQLWELFHENSKVRRTGGALTEQQVNERIKRLHASLPFEGYPLVRLPHPLTTFPLSLLKTITTRASIRNFTPGSLSLRHLATLLHYGYGVTRGHNDRNFLRPLRVVPSGGALYPLEIFLYTAHTKNLKAGLYHYNAANNHLRVIRKGNEIRRISESIVQSEVASSAAAVLFITAVFERAIFKYEDRGYRFILIEAGHVAQNINLVANALNLGSVNIGGFFDREIDDYLDLDGITHSTIYMIAIGKKRKLKT